MSSLVFDVKDIDARQRVRAVMSERERATVMSERERAAEHNVRKQRAQSVDAGLHAPKLAKERARSSSRRHRRAKSPHDNDVGDART